MTCSTAILTISRPGKGKGRRTILRMYDKNENLIREHSGAKCYAIAETLRRAQVKVVTG